MTECEKAWDAFLADEAAADALVDKARAQLDRAWERRVKALTKFRETVLRVEGESGWRGRWAKKVLYGLKP